MLATIFAKIFIFDVSLGSGYVSHYRLWIRLCCLYYFFHFESMKFRSGRSQMSVKTEAFQNIAILIGKQPCWSLFVIKLPAYKPANLLKGDSKTSILLLILLNSQEQLFFIEYLRWLYFKAMFETRQNFTMKNTKGFY